MLTRALTLALAALVLGVGLAGTASAGPLDWAGHATPDYGECFADRVDTKRCVYGETKAWLQEQYPPPCACDPEPAPT